MRKWKLFGLAAGVLTVLAFGLVLGVGTIPAQTTRGGAGDKEAPGKGKRAQAFLAAFNKGDAKAVAGFYTPTGDYTDHTGRKYQGREVLEKLYARVFAENKGAKLNVIVSSARLVAPEVAIEEGLTEVTPAEGGPPSVAAFSAVLVKKDGEWYFESVRESLAHPPSNAVHFEGIEWLLGDWTSEGTKGEGTRASYTWAENRNFIVSSFATTLNGIPVTGGTQWIAWDAVDKRIRSFSFYSGGGFGEATWSQTNGTWKVAIKARTAEGKKISATNVITPKDNDHCSFQVTQLTVDGKQLPDAPAVKMVRVKPEPPKKSE
jgi:uncharacterized protein (TIGR02246 family)